MSGWSGETRTPGIDIPNVARYQLRYTPLYSHTKGKPIMCDFKSNNGQNTSYKIRLCLV